MRRFPAQAVVAIAALVSLGLLGHGPRAAAGFMYLGKVALAPDPGLGIGSRCLLTDDIPRIVVEAAPQPQPPENPVREVAPIHSCSPIREDGMPSAAASLTVSAPSPAALFPGRELPPPALVIYRRIREALFVPDPILRFIFHPPRPACGG